MTTTDPVTFGEVCARLHGVLGEGVSLVREIHEGAYSRSRRWLVQLTDGTRAFVKAGRYPDPDHGLHLEAAVGELEEPFHPKVLGWDEGERSAGDVSVLVLEDLSHARWGTPLRRADVERLTSTLEQVASTSPPAAIPALDPTWQHMRAAWQFLAEHGDEVVATGLVDRAWLDANARALARLEMPLDLVGDQLVHGDLWMQNWCRLDDRGAVIVDWSGACRGNARINDAWAECAVRAAGGPAGVAFAPAPDEAAWAAWMCGRALDFAVQSRDDPRPRLVETIRREAAAALVWLCAACELPMPQVAEHARVDPAWRP